MHKSMSRLRRPPFRLTLRYRQGQHRSQRRHQPCQGEDLHAENPVVSPRELARPALGISFREHAEQAERLAEALSRTIKREIERLDNEGRNEPAWQDEIEFLKLVSTTLDQIAVAIREARQATTQEDQEKVL